VIHFQILAAGIHPAIVTPSQKKGNLMLRWILAFAVAAAACSHAAAQSAVERGSYLVNTIMTCANCHSPKGPPAAVAGKDYSGGLRFNEPPFDVTAPNITPDKETGIGNWTDEQIKTILLTGKNPHGVQAAEVMPSAFYPILTPGDLNAIVAYLRSLPPVKNKVPDPIYKIALPHHVFPGAEKAYSQADLNDKLKKGFYLVTIGHCMECHTPLVQGAGIDVTNSLGKGGREFPGPWGVSKARNITSSKTAGIGDWTDAEIRTAITQGKRKDGTPLKGPMGYQYYAKMTDADLDAVITYLRTVPAKD
jgi:mono/diheme cytochrome c family protein